MITQTTRQRLIDGLINKYCKLVDEGTDLFFEARQFLDDKEIAPCIKEPLSLKQNQLEKVKLVSRLSQLYTDYLEERQRLEDEAVIKPSQVKMLLDTTGNM